ncbi:MAG: CRISPR-associated endonuclease Cas1 [Acidobacteria bacterium]|nr:CRISPR-associated endonuclease Cas1 [Acidobacteriota bacterium]
MAVSGRGFCAAVADLARLREAWRRVAAARGSGGVDGVTVDQVDPATVLPQLSGQLLASHYRPSPLRRAAMPKSSGGVRLLGIPTVTDRIVQSAVAALFEERWPAEHHQASFAYRTGSSAKAAATAFEALLTPECWVITADIERFFDAVDHTILLGLLRGLGLERDGLALIESWIRAPILDRTARYQPVRGIPQGGPISPVLANLYLTAFDRALEQRRSRHVRYADDFVIVEASEPAARATLTFVAEWLDRERRLTIKPAKTQYVRLAEGCSFVGFWFTPGARGIPLAKRQEFMSRITSLTDTIASGGDLATLVEEHNELVVGWRAYYFGVNSHLDGQLTQLDQWRSERGRRALGARGLDSAFVDVILQRLVRPVATPVALDPYANAVAAVSAIPGFDWLPDDTGVDPWRMRLEPVGAKPPRTSTKSLRVQAQSATQLPALLAGQALHVPTHGAYLSKHHGTLVVRRQKTAVFECAFNDVRHVAIEAEGVGLSGSALAEFARRRVSVLVCRSNGLPLARIVPVRCETRPGLAERQVSMRVGPRGTALAIQLLTAKILNQRALLLYHSKYPSRPDALRRQLIETARQLDAAAGELQMYAGRPLPDVRARLLLIEARAALAYWRAFRLLVPATYGFPGRRKQDATDPVNAALNYGYWTLTGRTWQALETQGLHPYIGFLHTSRRDLPGLVFDAMEEFRAPLVDRAVLALLGRRAVLTMKADGVLRTRARVRIARAMNRALGRRIRGRPSRTVLERIHVQAKRVRLAVSKDAPYRGFRMQW